LKKIPISIQVIIFCDDKNILLLQRKDNPNYWQSVTGSIEKDESPKQCAGREVFEETGLIVNDYNFYSLNQMIGNLNYIFSLGPSISLIIALE